MFLNLYINKFCFIVLNRILISDLLSLFTHHLARKIEHLLYVMTVESSLRMISLNLGIL